MDIESKKIFSGGEVNISQLVETLFSKRGFTIHLTFLVLQGCFFIYF